MLSICYFRTECLYCLTFYLLLLGVFSVKLCSRDYGMQEDLQAIPKDIETSALVHTVNMIITRCLL